MKHGILGTYTNHHCRCDLCKKANAEHQSKFLRIRYKNGRKLGVKCKFGGCDKEAIMDNGGLCYAHSAMIKLLLKKGTRTKSEIAMAFTQGIEGEK